MTLHPLTDLAATVLSSPVVRLFDAQAQTFWPTYLFAVLIAITVYFLSRRSRRTSARGALRYLFPARLFRRSTTWLDAKMYIFSSLYLAFQGAAVLGGLDHLSEALLRLGASVFGPAAPDHPLPLWANITIPVLLYLALELGYWVSHWLLHRIPWLWEFHKVHHSAEVLTPLTEWRQHPVEYFIVPVTITVATSLVLAPLQWVFGPHMRLGSMWSPGLLILIFSMTIVHLRHSHVKLNAPGWLGYLIQSPQHHHIHHSTDPAHFDRNFGFCLSIWDWAFGTLTLPRKTDHIVFGLHDEHGAMDELVTSSSLRTHLWLPIKRAVAHVQPAQDERAAHHPAE